MQVKSIAECSKGSILQYFRSALSYHLSLRSFFRLFLSGHLRKVLLYMKTRVNLHVSIFFIFINLLQSIVLVTTVNPCLKVRGLNNKKHRTVGKVYRQRLMHQTNNNTSQQSEDCHLISCPKLRKLPSAMVSIWCQIS